MPLLAAHRGRSLGALPRLSASLEPGCPDDELRAFIAREEESHCAMCAANPERFELANPIRVHARALG